MIIDCISDLHGHYPKLEDGDLLIIAGDLTAHDEIEEYMDFEDWLDVQSYKCKIIVAGNHDNKICADSINSLRKCHYLKDSGFKFKGLNIWGSPWTKRFEGMNPNCMAFTVDTEEELSEKWDMIPHNTDILITHSPVYGFLDILENGDSVGCPELRMLYHQKNIQPKLHVFGHIHEGYGIKTIKETQFINASHINELYKSVNKPIRVVL